MMSLFYKLDIIMYSHSLLGGECHQFCSDADFPAHSPLTAELHLGHPSVECCPDFHTSSSNYIMLCLSVTIRAVRGKIQAAIAETFGLDPSLMYLTKPTFFSRINSTTAKTQHDEYWHPHIDKVTHENRPAPRTSGLIAWMTFRLTVEFLYC